MILYYGHNYATMSCRPLKNVWDFFIQTYAKYSKRLKESANKMLGIIYNADSKKYENELTFLTNKNLHKWAPAPPRWISLYFVSLSA